MSPRPLLLTRDPDLLDDVRRVAAAAGRDVDAVPGAAEARRGWTSAPLVLVGAELLAEAAAAGLRRRPGVLAVVRGEAAADTWRLAVDVGAEHVLELPEQESRLVELVAAADAPQRPGSVLGVVGGAGGSGASVLAAGLALAAARAGQAALLVDGDPWSGGIDLVLGCEDADGARWEQLHGVRGLVPADALRAALPQAHGVAVLALGRGAEPLPVAAVPAVLDSAASAFDAVVVDLPRGHPDLLSTLVSRCDEVLLVVPLDVRGASASMRPAAWLAARARTGLVARHLPHSSLDPDELALWLGLDVVAEIGHDSRLAAAVDRGDAVSRRSRLARTCDELVATTLAPAGLVPPPVPR
ncbi:MAG: chromosome partitioning protein [Frankiales bacterium]|nr:chromosome partitioning protein [Frankiales bacterium]